MSKLRIKLAAMALPIVALAVLGNARPAMADTIHQNPVPITVTYNPHAPFDRDVRPFCVGVDNTDYGVCFGSIYDTVNFVVMILCNSLDEELGQVTNPFATAGWTEGCANSVLLLAGCHTLTEELGQLTNPFATIGWAEGCVF